MGEKNADDLQSSVKNKPRSESTKPKEMISEQNNLIKCIQNAYMEASGH